MRRLLNGISVITLNQENKVMQTARFHSEENKKIV